MLLILGGLGIFARWPFEELCSAEDDATHPWRPWHLRQVAVRGALQRRGRWYSSLAALASSPGGRSRSSAAQRTIVLPHAYDVLGTSGESRARSAWLSRESRRPQARRNRQHYALEIRAIHAPSGVDWSCHDLR